MKYFLAAAFFALVLVIMGIAGNDDLQNEIDTAKQTAEIKQAMKQRHLAEARDDAAYRELFINRVDSDK